MNEQSELIETLQGNVDYLQGQLDIEIAEKKKLQAEIREKDKTIVEYLQLIRKHNHLTLKLSTSIEVVMDIVREFNKI